MLKLFLLSCVADCERTRSSASLWRGSSRLETREYSAPRGKHQGALVTDSMFTDVQLLDFGLSHLTRDPTALRSRGGTWVYCPPEAFSTREQQQEYCDNWALGIPIYMLLMSYHPFDDGVQSLVRC